MANLLGLRLQASLQAQWLVSLSFWLLGTDEPRELAFIESPSQICSLCCLQQKGGKTSASKPSSWNIKQHRPFDTWTSIYLREGISHAAICNQYLSEMMFSRTTNCWSLYNESALSPMFKQDFEWVIHLHDSKIKSKYKDIDWNTSFQLLPPVISIPLPPKNKFY